jgi:hypothetical protein
LTDQDVYDPEPVTDVIVPTKTPVDGLYEEIVPVI